MGLTKIIKSGNIIEIFEYERKLPENMVYRSLPKRRSVLGYRRKNNVFAMAKRFRRLVQANLVGNDRPSFLTLTIKEVTTLVEAYRRFRLFTQSLRYHFSADLRYIAVPEFQKRGAVHFHLLVWGFSKDIIKNERQTRFIAKLWGQGFVDIFETDGHSKLAGYLAKYMSKAMFNSKFGTSKGYVASRNVMRPVSFSNSLAFELKDYIWGVDNLIPKTFEFDTLWLGRCYYKMYNLNTNEI